MEWLRDQKQAEREAILALAQSKRKSVHNETQRETHLLLEHKIDERKKLVEKSVEKEMKRRNEIHKLKSDPLITTLD